MYTFVVWVISWAMWVYKTTQGFLLVSCCWYKGSVLLLIYTNKFQFIVLDLSFSFRYLVQLKLLQSLKNEATSAQVLVISSWINWISRLKKFDQLSCIEFIEVYLVRELVSENEEFSRGRRRSLLVSNTLPNTGSLIEQSWCY